MVQSVLHFLDARGTFGANRMWLARILRDADATLRTQIDPGPVDIAVRPGRNVIPERGLASRTPGPGQVVLIVDPDSSEVTRNPNGALQRMLAHAMYLVLRRDGPGYGESLGAAMVSEGLASHFAQGAFNAAREPWTDALADDDLEEQAEAALRAWERTDYDHDAWFHGRGRRPRWTGYTIGARVVANVLDQEGVDAVAAADWPAERFRPG